MLITHLNTRTTYTFAGGPGMCRYRQRVTGRQPYSQTCTQDEHALQTRRGEHGVHRGHIGNALPQTGSLALHLTRRTANSSTQVTAMARYGITTCMDAAAWLAAAATAEASIFAEHVVSAHQPALQAQKSEVCIALRVSFIIIKP